MTDKHTVFQNMLKTAVTHVPDGLLGTSQHRSTRAISCLPVRYGVLGVLVLALTHLDLSHQTLHQGEAPGEPRGETGWPGTCSGCGFGMAG